MFVSEPLGECTAGASTMQVCIDTQAISDRSDFHTAFASAFGFPAYYGRNMDAWIDCMSELDEPSYRRQSEQGVVPGEPIILEVTKADAFRERCPALFEDLLVCTAFVNQRYRDGAPARAYCCY